MADKRIGVTLDINTKVSGNGLQTLQSTLEAVANKANSELNPGKKIDQGLKEASVTATKLSQILSKSFNSDLGVINVTKFNQELKNSGLTLQTVQTNLSKAGAIGVTAYNKTAQAILNTNMQLKQSNTLLDSMATTMMNTVKWGITSSIFNTITNSITKAYGYVKQLDSSLNDIRIVTGKSAEEMDKFAEKANDAAKALGASTLDYSKASLIYYQQGLSDQEAQARAETTVKVANVTGQTGNAVSEQLTAVWNGYKVSAEETEKYVDKLAAVAATTAADLEELSIGMSKVASAANAMGVNFDDLNAQIATIVSVTRQAPESVGTALKTIYARLGDLKVDGVDEFGVKLGEVSGQLQTMGIEILDQNGNMRDMSSVMTEVAEKWNTWTRAQQQAAAVAMAGKRQYNNLVALFENWDMYSKALDTSKDSLGTLQEQQDTYMESTSAKLKTLQATWQELYKNLLKSDEINKLIEALTKLISLSDKFIKSFGGGFKSIASIGAIISNIFSKQISNGIIRANQKLSDFKNNMQSAQAIKEVLDNKVAQLGSNATSQDIAAQKGAELNFQMAQKTYEVRHALTNEQYNELVNYQREAAQIEENLAIQEAILDRQVKRTSITAEHQNMLKEGYEADIIYSAQINELQEKHNNSLIIQETLQEKVEEIENTQLSLQDLSNKKDDERLNIIEQVASQLEKTTNELLNNEKISKNITKEDKILLEQYQQQGISAAQMRKIIEELYRITNKVKEEETQRGTVLKQNLTAIQQEAKEAQKLEGRYQKRNQLAEQAFKIQSQYNQIYNNAFNNKNIIQSVTGITSALGSLAMALSSINMLIDTWNDKDKTVGQKMLQTILTTSFVLPGLIGTYQKFISVMGGSEKVFAILTARKKANLLITKAEKDAETANILTKKASMYAEEALAAKKRITNTAHISMINNIKKEIAARNINLGSMSEEQAMETINTIAKEKRYKISKLAYFSIYKEAQAEVAHTAALGAETTATESATAAQTALNIAMDANPLGAVILAITALVAAITIAITWYDKWQKKLAEQRKEHIEEAQSLQEELNKNEELLEKLKETAKAYEEGTGSKEDFISATEILCDTYDIEISKLDKVTENYDNYINKIKEARKEELELAQATLEIAKEDALQDVVQASKNSKVTALQGADGMLSILPSREEYNSAWSSLEDQYMSDYIAKDSQGQHSGFVFDVSQAGEAQKFYDSLLKYYNQLRELHKEGILSDELWNSSYITQIKDYLDSTKDSIAQLNTVNDNYYTTIAKIQALDFDAANYTNLQDFEKDYNKIIEDFSKKEKISIETAKKYINEAFSQNKSINKFLEQLDIKDALQEQYSNLTEESLNNIINKFNKEDLIAYLKLGVTLDENKLEDTLNYVKAKTESELNQNKIDISEKIRENIVSNKEISDEDKDSFNSLYGTDEDFWTNFDLATPIKQIQLLNEKIEENNLLLIKNQNYLNDNKEIQSTFLNRKKDLEQEIESYSDQIEKIKKSSSIPEEVKSNLIEDLKNKLNKSTEELEKIDNTIKDYAESFSVEDQLIELFDNRADQIISIAEQAKSAAELIGEGFIVAAEDAQELIDQYPEILRASEVLANGDIQLNQEVVKTILGGNAEVIESNADVTRKKLEQEIAVIQAQIKFNYTRMEILDKYLKGEIDKTEKEEALEKAATDYKTDLANVVGEAQVSAAIEAARANKELTDATIQDFEVIIQAASEVGIAIQQALRGETVTASVSGLSATGGDVAAYSKYSSVASQAAYDKAQGQVADLRAAEQEMADLKNETVNLEKTEAELKGILSKINSGTAASTEAIKNVMAGKAGKQDKSSSGSKSKEEEPKKFEDEFDRYWEYKKAIDLLDKSLSRLEKQQSKLHGKELIESLKKENELLEQQKANYDALFEAQKREAGELQGILQYYGGAFKDNGELANYADLTSNMLNQLTSGQVSEKAYEDFKKALERYDSLYYSEMQDTMDKLDDARRKQLENNLKAWETEIQIKLDLTEAKRNWNDFVRDIEQDFRKIYEDLTIESLFDTKNFKEYNEDLNTTLQAIYDVENEINKLSATGKSDMFQSMSEAQEKLKDLSDELIENGKNLYELYENIWDNYIDKLDQAADNLKDINEEFEHITTELEYEKKLIELIYGDKAYAKMDKFYTTQQKNINAQLNSLKTQRDFWEQQFNAAYEMNKANHNVILNDMSTWTEDMRKAYDEMIDSQEKLNDMIIDGINNLTDKYLNKLAETFDKLEKATWGMNLDDLKDDWDRITDLANEYLDDAEGIPQIQMLINKVNQGIDDTKDLKLQQKLAEFRDNEVQALMDKKDLTEDDLKLMEARYNIMLKEAALEDAQNAKNSMKLTRNSSGNWTYQYVADDTDVAEKQNDLLQSYQDLYKMADDAYQHAMELAMSSYETMQEKIKEIAEDTTITEEEKMIKIQEIQDTYLPMIQAAAENSELYRQEAIAATSMIFTEVCKQNEDAYEHLTDEQKILVDATKENHLNDYEAIREAIVDNTYPAIQEAATTAFEQTNLNSSTVAADIIGQWAGDDGESVKNKLNEAIDDIEKNTQDFEDELNNMRDIADIDFTDTDTMIDTTTSKIEEMGNKTEDMVNRSTPQLELMRQYVNDIEVAFGNVIERVFEAISVMAEYTEATAAAAEEMNNLIITSQKYGGVGISNIGGSGPEKSTSTGNTSHYKISAVTQTATADGKWIEDFTYINSTTGTGETIRIKTGTQHTNQDWSADELKKFLENAEIIQTFATGGYTGEWDTSGKLAVLHQKELVLNQDDTENFLKATSLLNNISKINGNIEDSIMTSILNMMGALAPKVSGFSMDNKSSEVSGNVFNITAEFPNANDVSSIKEAILSLPNIASQYVHQRS